MRKEIEKSRVRSLETAGGVFCFIAGILAASLGSLLTASGWIIGVEVHPWIHGAGTGLLIITIPLIIFSGFCLDWAEKRPNKASDNDCDPRPGKASPAPILISEELKRGFDEAEAKPHKKTISSQVKRAIVSN